MERVRDIRAREADRVRTMCPEEVHCVRDDVRDPREDNALTLPDQPIDERPPEIPDDPMLHRVVGTRLAGERQPVDREVRHPEVVPEAGEVLT
eukprot:9159697-Alexandrium_andersonii.AAC.1